MSDARPRPPSRTLADGAELPLLGFGTWQIRDGEPAVQCVGWALEAGYRHIDTAQRYGNEAGVGRALARSGIPREEVFLTTKFDPAARDPVEEAERSLERLGLDRIDLYLVHWPLDDPLRAWPRMVRARERGLARSIGVSNYGADQLAAVCAGDDPPVVDQVQLSPFEHRRALLEACERLRVAPAAWSPLTRGAHLAHPVVAEVARSSGRTPAQALLRWGVQRGLIVIPKSSRRERIRDNALVFDFSLSAEQMAALDALDRTGGTGRAQEGRSPLRRLAARIRRP